MKTPLAIAATLLLATSAAQAQIYSFAAVLAPEASGATGSGSVQAQYDAGAHTLSLQASFSGLSGTTTMAHIHCCTNVPMTGNVGVAVSPGTLPGFPLNVSSGTFSTVLDLTSSATYTGGFVNNFGGGTLAGAEAALFAGMTAGTAYFNVHTTTFPGGEIRGYLQPVPEPATWALLACGLAAVAGLARRRAA